MKQIGALALWLLACSAHGAVNISLQDSNGRAAVLYECTAGEVIQAFALDVSVNQGQIIGISDYFKGLSTPQAQGYGIFPAAFRDHIHVTVGGDVDWNVPGYTPLAVAADDPANTLPGLGSFGVTLEFGALWDTADTFAAPPSAGLLCTLELSGAAQVTVTTNASRRGVISAGTGANFPVVFTGAVVQPTEITGINLDSEAVTISFTGGELQTAPAATGPWAGTGNSSGTFTTNTSAATAAFFRVRRPHP